MSGCTIHIGENAQDAQNNQQTQQNEQSIQKNEQQAQSEQSEQDDTGKKEDVGRFIIQVNGLTVSKENDTSQPKNGVYVIVDARVENTSDQPMGLFGKARLTNANGQTVDETYSPYGVTQLNYSAETIPPNSYYTHGVLVFDIAEGGPYTLTIEDDGDTKTWKLQP